MLVKIWVDQELAAALSPSQLNFLIQCLSLNVSYTDDLDEHFYFGQDKPYKLEDGSKFEVSAIIKEINLQLLDTNEKEVMQVQAQRLSIESLFYWNEEVKTTISADAALIADHNIGGNKTSMLHAKLNDEGRNSKVAVIVQVSTVRNKERVVSLYSTRVVLEECLYVFRLNTLLMVLHVADLIVPDYEALPYKPYRCKLWCGSRL